MKEMIMFTGDKDVLEQIEAELITQGYSTLKHSPTTVRDGYVGEIAQGAFVLLGTIGSAIGVGKLVGLDKIIIEYIKSNKIDIEFTPDGKILKLSCHKRNFDKIITMFEDLRPSLLVPRSDNLSNSAVANCIKNNNNCDKGESDENS